MKQKIQLFLIFSISETLMWSLIYWPINKNIFSYIIVGTISGFLFTFILSVWQYIVLKAKGIKGKVNVISSVQFIVEGTQNDVFDLCKNSVETIKGCKIGYYDPREGLARARTATSLRNIMGDEITFHIKERTTNSYSVLIISRPILKTAIIDLGRNLQYINQISDYFKSNKNLIVIQEGGNHGAKRNMGAAHKR